MATSGEHVAELCRAMKGVIDQAEAEEVVDQLMKTLLYFKLCNTLFCLH